MPFKIKTFSSDPEERARRNSTKMAAQREPAMLAYRDENNTSIKYSPAAPQPQQSTDDSDGEALIQRVQPNELSDYDKQHFTASGRPQPAFKASGLANLAGDMFSLPQLLPKRYTDDSIVPAIITDVIPVRKANAPEIGGKSEKKGLLGKLKGSKKEDKDRIMRVVYMPRRDYQKWFARDQKGNYIGSEEHRRWTEEELEAEFAKYKPDTKEVKTGFFSGTGGSGTKTSSALGAVSQGLS